MTRIGEIEQDIPRVSRLRLCDSCGHERVFHTRLGCHRIISKERVTGKWVYARCPCRRFKIYKAEGVDEDGNEEE